MAKIHRDDTEIFHDYDLHVPSRTVFLGNTGVTDGEEDGVNYLMAERAIKNLHLLDNSGENPINIIINSLGGDFVHGQAIYDAIRSCKNRVVIRANGYCMSAASFIMQAGDERLMYEHSTMMIHYGSTAFGGDAKNVNRWVDWSRKGAEWMEKIYLEKIRLVNPEYSKDKVKKMLSHDFILSAEEALSIGLVDGIIGPEGKIKYRLENV